MKKNVLIIGLIIFLTSVTGYSCKEVKSTKIESEKSEMDSTQDMNLEKATFGGGCFWCTEAIYERVEGVHSVVSGYAGGTVKNPTYKQVCDGTTGHAEVTQITYDPKVVSYDELLEIFFKTHDPTTLNRQGADIGTQYRSVIFYHNDEQKQKAEYYKSELNKSGAWDNPVVTEISPLINFYSAEDYHQDYYANNPNQGYCAFVIGPKVEKFEKVFKNKLKKKYSEQH
ncbi:MAG: peptide-methionine (S)-S-oxide reductase [Ignavibacteria bacterium GWA2_35_9]|nr:MAG: peptide-methionine (S)-S-oxide reductase [Ignavibacteria bacterium GWA2_35_9]OGU48291.1 MAG: peptide-methionine (S)-S-oxide reductase [Ignavibacteria bacterium GWB2_36_8]